MLTEIVRFAVISYKFYQLFPSIPFFFIILFDLIDDEKFQRIFKRELQKCTEN